MSNTICDWNMGWEMPFLWILFWVVIIAAVIYIVKFVSGDKALPEQGQEQALTILKQRYAKGEIDQETYLKMKEELNHD